MNLFLKTGKLAPSLLLAVVMSTATVFPALFSPDTAIAADAPRVYKTRTGKTIIVSETHPAGRSLSTIEVRTEGFEHNYGEVFEERDPVSDVFGADLDGNGFDEIYIITKATGSGSYGKVLAFASNRDKSLSILNFSEIREGDENFADT